MIYPNEQKSAKTDKLHIDTPSRFRELHTAKMADPDRDNPSFVVPIVLFCFLMTVAAILIALAL